MLPAIFATWASEWVRAFLANGTSRSSGQYSTSSLPVGCSALALIVYLAARRADRVTYVPGMDRGALVQGE